MEFLEYKETLAHLKSHGVVERAEGSGEDQLIRFDLDDSEQPPASVRIGIVDASESEVIQRDRSSLGDAAEAIVAGMHIDEIAIFPTKRWREILDLVAFDLAEDEAWLEVDAEAAMHQNGRDPLVLVPRDRHLLTTLINALMNHAESPLHEITVVAMDAPVIIQVGHTGVLNVSCANEAMLDKIARVARA